MSGKPSCDGSVVVALDQSAATEEVLGWAGDEARLRAVPLVLLSVNQPPVPPPTFGYMVPIDDTELDRLQEAAEKQLTEAAATVARLHPDLRVETRLESGLVARTILDLTSGAALLVLGTHRHGELHDLMLGSISRQVAAHSRCPVVVVPTVTSKRAGSDAGRVVVGVDDSPANAGAVEFAFEYAERHGLALTAVHAWDIPATESVGLGAPILPADYEEVEEGELRLMSEALGGRRERHPGVAVRQRIVHGNPAMVLCDASHGAAALVVGSRGRGGFSGLLLGSVSHSVLHHAHCPVIVVRTAE